LYTLKDEFKQLTRERRRLDQEYRRLVGFYDDIWNAAVNVILGPFVYLFAMGYFVARIFLFKVGLLVSNIKEKRQWKKRRKKGKRTFHVHSTVLNIDKRLQEPTLSFDTDASTVICDNSANVHICNNKSFFVGPL